MADPKAEAKAAKKAVKAQAKIEKKRANREAFEAGTAAEERPNGDRDTSKLTPAERAAVAAERQVRLHAWRVVIALLMFLVGLLTFLFTARPWEWW